MSRRRFRLFLSIVSLVGLFGFNALGQSLSKEAPAEKPTATKVLELGKVLNRSITNSFDIFWRAFDRDVPLVIINYGTDKEILRREKLILNSKSAVRIHHHARITVIRGGVGKGPNTVVWKVPAGAALPEP